MNKHFDRNLTRKLKYLCEMHILASSPEEVERSAAKAVQFEGWIKSQISEARNEGFALGIKERRNG